MLRNEGSIDRVLRILLGVAALAAAFLALDAAAGAITGIVVAGVGVVLILTGLIGFCPAYRLVGLSTCAVKKA